MKVIANLECVQSLNKSSQNHIVILHGYGANAHDLLSLKNYWDPQSLHNWYFVNGFLKLNMSPMMDSRAWFPIDMVAYEAAMREGKFRDLAGVRPAGLDEARDRLLKFIKEILPQNDHLILGGFSQGAMLSTELSFYLASQLKGLILLSGSYVDEASWSKKLSLLKDVPFIQSHGEQDPILSFDEARRLYDSFTQSGVSGEFLNFKGQHEIPLPVIDKVKNFLNQIA